MRSALHPVSAPGPDRAPSPPRPRLAGSVESFRCGGRQRPLYGLGQGGARGRGPVRLGAGSRPALRRPALARGAAGKFRKAAGKLRGSVGSAPPCEDASAGSCALGRRVFCAVTLCAFELQTERGWFANAQNGHVTTVHRAKLLSVR